MATTKTNESTGNNSTGENTTSAAAGTTGSSGKSRTGKASNTVSSTVSSTVDRITETAKTAQRAASDRASEAARATTEALDANPLSALAGAIAIGAVAAAFIPTTRREIEALGPWAEKLRESAQEAYHAAREAGTGELTAGGLTLAAASDGVGGIVGKIVKAVTASATAASTSVRGSREGNQGATASSGATEAPAPIDA